MISSAGKYLVTPIWSWFDLVGSAQGECCSPNFVKIIIKNPPFYPFFHFQEIVVSVTRALANCFICLFLKLHSKALTRFIHKTCQELFSSDGRILKVKLSLEGCIFYNLPTQYYSQGADYRSSQSVQIMCFYLVLRAVGYVVGISWQNSAQAWRWV